MPAESIGDSVHMDINAYAMIEVPGTLIFICFINDLDQNARVRPTCNARNAILGPTPGRARVGW